MELGGIAHILQDYMLKKKIQLSFFLIVFNIVLKSIALYREYV